MTVPIHTHVVLAASVGPRPQQGSDRRDITIPGCMVQRGLVVLRGYMIRVCAGIYLARNPWILVIGCAALGSPQCSRPIVTWSFMNGPVSVLIPSRSMAALLRLVRRRRHLLEPGLARTQPGLLCS